MDEIPTALLVALMFVTVLSMGIGNILANLADIVHAGVRSVSDRLQVSWVTLLLLVHLDLFWQTLDLFNLEEWEFAGFVFTLAGPILPFFAAHTMMAEPSGTRTGDGGSTKDTYSECSSRFFLIFALLLAWSASMDPFLNRDFTGGAVFDMIALIPAVLLAITRSHRLHVIGAWVFWILSLSSALARGLGFIS